MYTEYKKTVRLLDALGSAALSHGKTIDTFSQITEETTRLVEIMDIQDELGIVDSVLKTQKMVLQNLGQEIQKRASGNEKKAKFQKASLSEQIEDSTHTTLGDSSHIQEAIRIVDDNINSVDEMTKSAKRVQDDVICPLISNTATALLTDWF